MAEYQPNSHRAKEMRAQEAPAEQRMEKVVSGGARVQKRSALRQAMDAFLPGDVSSVRRYVLRDVLIPTIQRAISEIVRNSIDMMLGVNTSPRTNPTPPGGRVSYRSYYDARDDRREAPRPRPAIYNYDEVVFDRFDDAAEVLLNMRQTIKTRDAVSVADLLDMAGCSSQYTDNRYGWTDLSDARLERVGTGYIIRLPRPVAL